jgi:hypothetical protein
MERGRFSKEYAQFLCDRFYRRYKETCSLKVGCNTAGCDSFKTVRANDEEDYDRPFRCEDCKKTEYQHSSDDE